MGKNRQVDILIQLQLRLVDLESICKWTRSKHIFHEKRNESLVYKRNASKSLVILEILVVHFERDKSRNFGTNILLI